MNYKVLFAIFLASPAMAGASLLQQLVGQTCRANTGLFDVIYTIDQKNGQWAVHDLFGKKGISEAQMKDVGWRLAKVEGDSLTFQGLSAYITLRAVDAHTVDGHFMQTNPASPGVSDYRLSCTPTPAEQRWDGVSVSKQTIGG